MPPAICNSGPLIHFGKVKALNILTYFFQPIYIPNSVFEEVVTKGIQHAQPDALLVHALIKENRICVVKEFPLSDLLNQWSKKNLHQGELDAIHLALSMNLDGSSQQTILLDDEEARKLARTLGLQVQGTLGTLIKYYQAKQISSQEAIQILNNLNDFMYISSDLYQFCIFKLNII